MNNLCVNSSYECSQIEDMSRYILLVVLAACVVSTIAIVCTPEYCNHVNCTTAVPDDHKLPCKDNQRLTTNFCDCCQECFTIVGKIISRR